GYLREYPEPGPAASLPACLLCEEFRVRQLHGDQPELSSYRARFPGQYEELCRLVRAEPISARLRTSPRSWSDIPLAVSGPGLSTQTMSNPYVLPVGGGYRMEKLIGRG